MRKALALLLLVVILFSTACSKVQTNTGESQVAPSAASAAYENMPAFAILYPELIPPTLTNSKLYQKAVFENAVICYNGEPVTSKTIPEKFVKEISESKSCELNIYSFADNKTSVSCVIKTLKSTGKEHMEQMVYTDNWEEAEMPSDSYAIKEIVMTEYGYLTYSSDSSSEPGTSKVVNDRELWSNAAEKHKMYDTYLAPIFYTALGEHFWQTPHELTQWIWLYEDIYQYENNSSPFDKYGMDWPIDDMLSLLNKYFDGVTRDEIISTVKATYNAKTNTIHYEGGRGGGPFPLRVVSWEENDDTLTIHYENYDFVTGIPYENASYQLTVKLMDDGSFRYLSNQPMTV